MAILGTLLKRGISLRESLEQQYTSPLDLQKHELRGLLIHAQHTKFGKHYHFSEILKSFKTSDADHFYKVFKETIPIHDYNKINAEWWEAARNGGRDVTWPGKTKYYALSSGTSGAASKHIPVTKDMVKSIRRTSVRQMLSLSKCDVPAEFLTKGILMLGGSTNLRKSGTYFEGDLSGITTSQIPFWFQHFYKPGKKIAKTSWDSKLDEITENAPNWDIGIIAGVPAWLQLLMEKIIKRYGVKTIHDIWPNLTIFVHGGVSFEPYRQGFERLLAKPLIYLETYLASEGFVAFQAFPDRKSMRMVLNNGIFYEFIPFTEANFDEDGELRPNPETLKIDEVELNKEYALLISTNAGTWRYLIGDVIRFVMREDSEIVITGRTKHFLSLCGEHLSVDNMNKAVELASQHFNIAIKEFTVIGEPDGSTFTHHWYIGTDDAIDADELGAFIDQQLKVLNDDYQVERKHALSQVLCSVLPEAYFYGWMKEQGKVGAQNKFPRVLKKEKSASWKQFIERKSIAH